MTRRVRVIVWHRAADADRDSLEAAYDTISRDLAGTPGLLGNELLRDTQQPERFAVLSEWETLSAFQVWERGSRHRDTTSPLRPYQDVDRADGHFGVYEVTAAYRGTARERSDA